MHLNSCNKNGNYLIALSPLGIMQTKEQKIITTIMIEAKETKKIFLIMIKGKVTVISVIITVAVTTVYMKNHQYHSSNN